MSMSWKGPLKPILMSVIVFAGAAAPAEAEGRELTTLEKKIIAEEVAHDLKDPGSATFRWPPIKDFRKDFDMQQYCGMVNAKNSFGGYVGYRPFVVTVTGKGNRVAFAGIAGVANEDSEAGIFRMCAAAGYDPTTAE